MITNLDSINIAIICIFCIDTVLKLQLRRDYFYLDNSKIELTGFIFFIIYALVLLSFDLNHDILLTFEFIGALLVILRCKKRTQPLMQLFLDILGVKLSSTLSSMSSRSALGLGAYWLLSSSSTFLSAWSCLGM